GGDFSATASATTSVAAAGSYQWTGAGLVADVQQWVNTASSNFGWILTGNESTTSTVKQFDTKENTTAANRPVLTVDFSPGASQFAVSAPPSATAGAPILVTVTAKDSGGNTVTGYTGTVQLTSTDGGAIYNGSGLPATYTFQPSDAGVHNFTVTLTTAGSRTVTITDQANSLLTITTNPITVVPGAFAKYVVNVVGGSTLNAGDSFLCSVQAADSSGNAVASYSGPASVTVSASPADPQSSFPATVALNANGFGFTLGNLKTVGSYTLTAAAGGFGGAPRAVTVNPS